MDNQGDWSCDANDAVQITLVQPGEGKPTTTSTFHPQFTYPIFGDEERIFGYKGLIIRLRFTTHDLRTHVHISYDEKFKTVGDTAATDLIKTLRDWVPESAFITLGDYETAVQTRADTKDFVPPGQIVHSYSIKGRNYEIRAGSLADPKIRSLLERAQTFIPLFIEAGTPLVTDDPEWTLERWTVYFVYEIVTPTTPTAAAYSFVGYATTYRWWFYKPEDGEHTVQDGPFPYPEEIRFSTLPARLRIAQFLILPPHQNSGHGSHLYNTIHTAAVDDPTIVELTVEDPNESFDVLRDQSDYRMLRPEFVKRQVTVNANPYPALVGRKRPRHMPTAALIPTETLTEIRAQYKIAPTQFAHILEMFLLSTIPAKHRNVGGTNLARLLIKKHNADDENDRRYYWWRMLVKQRLYKRSRDILIQLDLSDRYAKLDETLVNVEEGYEALLKVFELREDRRALEALQGAEEGKMNGSSASSSSPSFYSRMKRKYAVVEDDEDEEDGDEGSSKRSKV